MNKMVKVQGILLIIVLILNMMFPLLSIATEDIVTITFEDENLYNAIATKIESKIQSKDDTTYTINIMRDNLESITSLHLSYEGISNISGIEKFTALISLDLTRNNLEDISVLEKLPNLTDLDVASNNIMDMSVLERFSNLTSLDISNNNVEEISFLSSLSNLTSLSICRNNITSIASLKNLTNLTYLCISDNKLTDISDLANLINLKYLMIGSQCYHKRGGSSKSTNNIADITALKGLTNLEILGIDGIGVSDIKALENLTKLRGLHIGSNQIEDISALSNLTALTEISMDQNNIQDVVPLANLVNLKLLSLGKNKVSNIEDLNNLVNLETLNISYNNVSDISVIGNFTKLKILSMGDNANIVDIQPLISCESLKTLYVPHNNIKDISVLKNLNLTSVAISGNRIEDLSVMDECSTLFSDNYYYNWDIAIYGQRSSGGVAITSHPQLIEKSTEEKIVELPKIFIQAKDKNSKLYTEEEFILENCTLNEDENQIVIDDNVEKATIRIKGGAISGSTLTVNTTDITSPQLIVDYSTKELTNGTVTATITANEKVKPVEGWTLSEDELVLTKTYAKNMQEEVSIYDLAGNESKAQVSILNIDKEVPQAEIKYSTTKLTNKDVVVSIVADERVKEVDGWQLSQDKTILEKIFTENSTEQVEICDLAGNKRIIPIEVNNIDKEEPKVDIEYSTKKLTNGNVEVTLKADEKIQEVEGWIRSSDGKTLVKEFEKNTTEEVTIYDIAGNSAKREISVGNIDKIAPELEAKYNTKESTDENVKVTIEANEQIQPVEGWELSEDKLILTKIYTQNSEEEITVYDLAGNATKQVVKIANITKKDDTIAKTILPKTGKEIILIIAVVIALGILILCYKKYRGLKDVK